jgi:hypothetical protein
MLRHSRVAAALVLALGTLCAAGTALAQAAAPAAAPAKAPAASSKARALPTETKVWKGDLDGMIERRVIRVLVPHRGTLY